MSLMEWILIGAFAAVWLLTVFGVWHVRRAASLRQAHELQVERARIARDIHDDLGNGLAAVATLSDLAHGDVERGKIHERLDQIYELAQSLARSVDEIVWAVNPENDSWESFINYFEQYTTWFLDNSKLRFQVVCPQEARARVVPSKVRHHVVLAAREAVTNVLKHAQARNVRVEVRPLKGAFEVEVSDDGCGFDASKPQRGGQDGLANMARRMREIGGTCDVTSGASGTRIVFKVPEGERV